MKILQSHPVPVVPLALQNLWGSVLLARRGRRGHGQALPSRPVQPRRAGGRARRCRRPRSRRRGRQQRVAGLLAELRPRALPERSSRGSGTFGACDNAGKPMAGLKDRPEALPASALKGIAASKRKACAPADGLLGHSRHTRRRWSALTHPHITTDYSDRLELITGAHADIDACLDELTQIHQFARPPIGGGCCGSAACLAGCRPTRTFPSACTAPSTSRVPRASTAWA